MKTFNTTGVCNPQKHYMVDLTDRMKQMKSMVDSGHYFTINRARQYGKTTTLTALGQYLQTSYIVVDLDFQDIGDAGFADEDNFSRSFATIFSDALLERYGDAEDSFILKAKALGAFAEESERPVSLLTLFRKLQDICHVAAKPIVLMVDEVDSATNNQVFWDFLAQLRSLYLKRGKGKNVSTFQSVILAGVTDVKNLKRKLGSRDSHKYNSPWNIATDFNVDMSLSEGGIAGMLSDYEEDHHTGMDAELIAKEIHAHTNGYPFLVSRICQLIDTQLIGDEFKDLSASWTIGGVSEAARRLLVEKNTLFESLMGKVDGNAELANIFERILFAGDMVSYNPDNPSIHDAEMFGFVRNDHGNIAIANRIFEVRLYNYYLSANEMQASPLYRMGATAKSALIQGGHLLMDKVMERYLTVYDDIYGEQDAAFDEAEGRRRFLLYIRPIINGTGNYYIETQTRNNERMDLVIDFLGERHVIELKIWRGQTYHEKGEKQLAGYLNYYHLNKGYLLTYNFNKGKVPGQRTVVVDEKTLVETTV